MGERIWLEHRKSYVVWGGWGVGEQTEEQNGPVKRRGFPRRRKVPRHRHPRRHSHHLHLTVHRHRYLHQHHRWDRPVRP